MDTTSKQTVVIIGGTRDIGLCVGELLCDESVVHIVGRSSTVSKNMNNICCDITDSAQLNMLCSNLRNHIQPDILINCASYENNRPFTEIDDDDISKTFDTNVLAYIKICKSCIPNMQKNKFGKIIFITSIWSVNSIKYRGLYSSSKFALNGLSKSMANEFARDNIMINCVAPGFVNTASQERSDDHKKRLCERIPMNRLAKPEEIAHIVEWLSSKKCSYITGQTIIADGGVLNDNGIEPW